MLKKIVISLFTIFALSNFALADNHNNGIATVNVDKVKMETKAGKSIANQLMALQETFKDKVAKLQKDFDSKKQNIDKQKNDLYDEFSTIIIENINDYFYKELYPFFLFLFIMVILLFILVLVVIVIILKLNIKKV